MEKTEAKHEQVIKQAEQRALEHRQRLEANRMAELRRSAEQPTRQAGAGIHRDISSIIQEKAVLEQNVQPSMGGKTSQFRPDEIAHIRSHASDNLAMRRNQVGIHPVQEALIQKLKEIGV